MKENILGREREMMEDMWGTCNCCDGLAHLETK